MAAGSARPAWQRHASVTGQRRAPLALRPPASNAQAGAGVGLLYDHVMTMHTCKAHELNEMERPQRISLLFETLQQRGLAARCVALRAREATDAELERAHSKEYVARVDTLYAPGVTRKADTDDLAPLEPGGDALMISGDIYCNAHTRAAARTAAGCAVQAVEAVLDGSVGAAFAAVRPPGHHAGREDFSGFCFFNNAAAAAHAALARGLARVLIFDWDVHHGNGTQDIFYEDPRVLTVSVHRRDGRFYPEGKGYPAEVGSGPGLGFNVNVGWQAKGFGDADYLATYDIVLEPLLTAFDPQLVIIAAGFDAVEGDPLGGCHASPEGYGHLAARLMRLAGGRVVAVLEGGYNTGWVFLLKAPWV
ncbi:MAG: hypothetical protein J3K34DRAFT_249070 [Monoraphidium minutum]|nr:MAG: hypothetical protein J3K34DRAFT_249070 [Monoraphidium minutum]